MISTSVANMALMALLDDLINKFFFQSRPQDQKRLKVY